MPPLKEPLREAAPLPDTERVPPRLVIPATVSEPPETFRELVVLMVRLLMLSVPVE